MKMLNNNKKEILYSITLMVVPLAILFTTYIMSVEKKEEEVVKIQEETKLYIDSFSDLEIEAKSAIVKDLNTGEILFAKNADLSLPLASITKVLTVLTVDKLLKKDTIRITNSDLMTEGDSNLLAGENFNTQDLIDLTLSISSNDGATSLASNAISSLQLGNRRIDFIDEMNKLAQEIGMYRSRFYNETGLDENEKRAGAYGSANDIATLFEYAITTNKGLFEGTAKSNLSVTSMEGYVHNASNTNQIVDDLPNLIAGKTGFTDIAGGNLAVVIDPALNAPVAIVVLGSSIDGRFDDVEKLSEKTIEYFKNKK